MQASIGRRRQRKMFPNNAKGQSEFDAQQGMVEGKTLTEGAAEEYSIQMTDNSYKVREIATGRVICEIQPCAATRTRDLDAFILSYAPNGFFVHANPVQTNLGTKATGETYENLDAALVTITLESFRVFKSLARFRLWIVRLTRKVQAPERRPVWLAEQSPA